MCKLSSIKNSAIFLVGAGTFFIIISGCATVPDNVPDEEVLHVDGSVYEILDVDRRGIFGSESSLIDSVVSQANEFAAAKGKVATPLMARIHRVGILADWAWFYYKFSLVEKGVPEANRKLDDIEIERDPRLAGEFYLSRHKVGQKNSYDELIRLDELRKRGIITDAEFSHQKNLILKK